LDALVGRLDAVAERLEASSGFGPVGYDDTTEWMPGPYGPDPLLYSDPNWHPTREHSRPFLDPTVAEIGEAIRKQPLPPYHGPDDRSVASAFLAAALEDPEQVRQAAEKMLGEMEEKKRDDTPGRSAGLD
jgi:hypothetical protein